MKFRKTVNRLLSVILALGLLFGIVPSTLCAWTAPANVTINKSANAAYFTNQWGTPLQTGFYYVAGTNEIAYCADQEGTGPGGTGYSLNDSALGNAAYLAGIQAILQNGYPFTTNGLSADDARYATQIAIHWIENYYLGAGQGYDASIRGTTNANGHTAALAWALALYDVGVSVPFVMPKVVIGTPTPWTTSGGTTQCTVQVNEDHTDHWVVTGYPAGTSIVGGTNFTGDVNLIIQLTDPAAYAASDKKITAIGYTTRDLSNIHVFSTSGGYQSMVAVSTQSNGLDPDSQTLYDATGGFAIHKVTQTTSGDIPEAGAVFQIFSTAYASYDACPDSAKATITTDADGNGSHSGFPYGTYYLDQISAPTGVTTIPRQLVTIDATSISNPVTYLNTLGYGHIDLTKRINKTGTPLEPGAGFDIYLKSAGSYAASPADQRDQLVTDGNGHAVSKDLPYGTYCMVQTSAPMGLKIDPTVREYRIGMDGVGNPVINQTIYENVINDITFGRLRIQKTADIYAEAGAVFQIYPSSSASYAAAPADQRDQITTDATGTATSVLLPYGVYIVHQSFAPVGTIAGADSLATIGEVDSATVTQSLTNTVQSCTLSVEKQGETLITATKVDAKDSAGNIVKDGDGNALSVYDFYYEQRGMNGASFDVYVGSSDIVDYSGAPKTLDLDGNGSRETTLKAGTYLGRIATAAVSQGDGSTKYIASMSGLPLSADGTAQYIAKEAIAPSGQTLSAAPITFDFTYSNQAITEIAALKTVQDTKQDAQISVTKQKESATWNDTTKTFEYPIIGAAGIVFGLYTTNDILSPTGTVIVKKDSLVDLLITGADGKATTTKDLPLGGYYAKEIRVTDEIVWDKKTVYPVTVQPAADGTTQLVTAALNGGKPIVNRTIKGHLDIYKLASDTDLPMTGVEFEVFDQKGNLIDTITTDADGKANTKLLPYGQYFINETKTNTGYILGATTSFSIFRQPAPGELYSDTDLTLYNDKMATISVAKATKDDNVPMDGVVFGIYDKETGKEISRMTTDKDGKASVYVTPGSYYLQEISTWPGYSLAPDKIEIRNAQLAQVYHFSMNNQPTGVKPQKTNPAGEPLPGTEFMVQDTAGTVIKMYWDAAKGAYIALDSEKFKVPDGVQIVDRAVSGSDGTLLILGLIADKQYIITETKAPAGYNNDSKPVTVTVPKTSDVLGTARFVDTIITVKTGEEANNRSIIAGIGFLVSAGLLTGILAIVRKNRIRKEEEGSLK